MRQLALWCVVVLTGCASSRSSTRFTSPDELKRVMTQPKPAKVFSGKTVAVERWELVGPLPDGYADAPHESASPFSKVFADAAATKGLRASQPLACVARETARFVALKGNAPTQGLRGFIDARCGVPAQTVLTQWLTGTAPADVDEAKLAEQWRADVLKSAASIGAGERAGIGSWREGDTVVVALAHVRDETTIEPVSMTPGDDGFMVVRGVSGRRADTIFGASNQGATGTGECVNTGARPAPAFELKCPVSKSDETAWVSISARERGRVLGFEVLRLLARPSGATANTWTAPSLVAKAPGATAADFVTQLNAVRAKVGAPAVTLSEAQTADHAELAPFYFEASQRNDDALVDRIALGVMAGWRVEREIMNGTFGATTIEGSTASELLADLLESPGYRRNLLSPRVGVVAVGVLQEGPALGALVATYDSLQAPTWPDTANTVLTALNGQRQRSGRKPVQWVLLPSSGEPRYAEAVSKREYDSGEALQRFMSQASNVTGRAVRGWRIPVLDLDDIAWPPEVLTKESLELMFVVTTERDEKEPWGRYVLLMIILEGGAQPEA